MSELRQQMLADLRIRNYAGRTQEIYIRGSPRCRETSSGRRMSSAARRFEVP